MSESENNCQYFTPIPGGAGLCKWSGKSNVAIPYWLLAKIPTWNVEYVRNDKCQMCHVPKEQANA